jgi:feruloyl-CoA synthase
VILEGAPYVRDVVIAGHDRDFIAALVFPNIEACREICGGADSEVLGDGRVRARFEHLLECLIAGSTGSSNRVVRMIVLASPPSIDAHEITDKGSINQSAVLKNRADLVEELYRERPSPRIIAAGAEGGTREAA